MPLIASLFILENLFHRDNGLHQIRLMNAHHVAASANEKNYFADVDTIIYDLAGIALEQGERTPSNNPRLSGVA